MTDEDATPPIERRSRAVRTGSLFAADPGNEVLEEFAHGLERVHPGLGDDVTLVEELDNRIGWLEPNPPPLPTPIQNHRTGTCFEVESTEMRAACVDAIQAHLGGDAVVHEARHQRAGYHTDLVYADVDPGALADRDAMCIGDDPLHDPLQRFRVWWNLVEKGPKSRPDAIENGRYADPSKNRRHLEWLEDHGYVGKTATGHADAVVPPSFCDLHAVELKRRDWETALEQAARARRCDVDDDRYSRMPARFFDRWGYADYAWVALDAGAIDRALEYRDRFEDEGVGLLAIAEGGTVVEHLTADYRPRRRYTRDRAYIESEVWDQLDLDDWDLATDDEDESPEPTEPKQANLQMIANDVTTTDP